MRNIAGRILIVLGALLLAASLTLLGYNQWQNQQAEAASRALLEQMQPHLTESVQQPPPAQNEMPTVTLDGQTYVGVLSIPALALELPVMENWSYPGLKIAPCRFYGTVAQNNLVVMAHNYRKHFGNINQLLVGDAVSFTDANGHTTHYTVAEKDVLNPYAVTEATAGDYDLTLFTCTYGGRSRVTVYCNRA